MRLVRISLATTRLDGVYDLPCWPGADDDEIYLL